MGLISCTFRHKKETTESELISPVFVKTSRHNLKHLLTHTSDTHLGWMNHFWRYPCLSYDCKMDVRCLSQYDFSYSTFRFSVWLNAWARLCIVLSGMTECDHCFGYYFLNSLLLLLSELYFLVGYYINNIRLTSKSSSRLSE